jgi:membrane protein YdbS with pleckstrin-like domain
MMPFRAMKFPYSRFQFGIRFFLLIGILAPLLLVMRGPDIESIWLAVFGIIFFLAISLVTLTPIMTHHEITGEAIILRQGLLFKAVFPFEKIESVESSQTRLWAFGLFQAGGRGRIVLASGNRNIVEIKLKEKRRFGLLLWRSSKEIIIDVNKPEDFVRLAKDKMI